MTLDHRVPPDLIDWLRHLQGDVNNLKRQLSRSFTVLPNGRALFPGGIEVGGDDPVRPQPPEPGEVPPPTNLVLTPGADANSVWIVANWTHPGVDRVVSFQVLWWEGGPNEDDPIDIAPYEAFVSGTSLKIDNLRPNRWYTVTVRSYTRLGQESADLTGRAKTGADTQAPPKVQNFVLSSSFLNVFGTWDPVPDDDVRIGGYYEMQVATSNDFSNAVSAQNGGNTSNNSIGGDGTISTNVLYYGRVRAVDASGNQGEWSDVDTTTPGAPEAIPTDGVPPSHSPTPSTVTGAAGFMYARWDGVDNADPVTYEVYVSATPGFTPSPSTLVGETSGLFYMWRALTGNVPLQYATNYYVRLVAKDNDGAAAPSDQATGTMQRAGTNDLGQGIITADSAIIAFAAIYEALIQDLSVTNAKINDAAITTAKIGDLQVGTAKIASAAITNAKIQDLAVDNAKIANLAVTNAKINDLAANKITSGFVGAHTILLDGFWSQIGSSTYFSQTSLGWRIRGDGTAEFNNVTVRGMFRTDWARPFVAIGEAFEKESVYMWSGHPSDNSFGNTAKLGMNTSDGTILLKASGGGSNWNYDRIFLYPSWHWADMLIESLARGVQVSTPPGQGLYKSGKGGYFYLENQGYGKDAFFQFLGPISSYYGAGNAFILVSNIRPCHWWSRPFGSIWPPAMNWTNLQMRTNWMRWDAYSNIIVFHNGVGQTITFELGVMGA
jgi:hypothetical protein